MSGLPPVTELAVAFLAGGLVVGAAVWFLSSLRFERRRLESIERLSAAESRLGSERERRERAESELDAARDELRELDRRAIAAGEQRRQAEKALEEQHRFLERARQDLEDTFQALAATTLKGSSEQFLTLANERLTAARDRAAADLEERRRAIESLVAPLAQTLEKLDRRTGEVEKARQESYSRLDEQLRELARATRDLDTKTGSLATALKGSEVRGRWGEIALRNVAELAGMSPHCDFQEQASVDDGAGRPDMIVRLPGGRKIAVDAKAPLTAYLEHARAESESARQKALARHVQALRAHVRTLSSRAYAESLEGEVDLVVMFLPGDPFLSAAFATEPDLQVEALRAKVLIATPSTLVALLRTVAIYWQQQTLAENAAAIAETARELYDRAAKFGEDLGTVGKGLKTALEAYNRAVGSFDRRLIPMGRRLEEMKVSEQSRRRLEPPEPVAEALRTPRDD
ncbi:MAG: DNA recombination protein RmuC [Thermoanaerobaculia bacterium]|nr:DNA recombination protein RmuC [Thermoanaerobaculia bacterium]